MHCVHIKQDQHIKEVWTNSSDFRLRWLSVLDNFFLLLWWEKQGMGSFWCGHVRVISNPTHLLSKPSNCEGHSITRKLAWKVSKDLKKIIIIFEKLIQSWQLVLELPLVFLILKTLWLYKVKFSRWQQIEKHPQWRDYILANSVH